MSEKKNGLAKVQRTALAIERDALSIPSANGPGVGGESHHPGLLQVLWHRRWTVLVALVVALGCGYIYLRRATPIYSSGSTLLISQSGPAILKDNQGGGGSSGNYLYTQCELIKSSNILKAALESDGMASLNATSNPVGYLRMGLDASVAKNSDTVSVSFQSTNPDEAAIVPNAVVEAYMTFQSAQKRSTAAEVLKILQKEKDKRDTDMTDYLNRMLEFKRQNASLSFQTGRGNIVSDRLGVLSEALTQAQMAVIETQAELETGKAIKDDPAKLRQVVSQELINSIDGRTAALMARLDDLQSQRDRLKDRGTLDEHQSIRLLDAEMARVKAKIDELGGSSTQQLAEQYLSGKQQALGKAQFRVEQLQKAFDAQRGDAMDMNVKAAEYAKLETELRRTERLCEILDQRIKELNVTEDVGALNISILETAKRPGAPIYPQPSRILGIAMVLGLMAGLGLAMLQDLMDQRLRSAEEIQNLLGVPVLGIVPHMSEEKTVTERGMKVHVDSSSAVAEAYRTIRTAVYFGIPDANAKKLLVTSPAPGDGKSTTASNIAIAMAMAGQRTLIIDGDFRRPVQHSIFEVSDEVGLSSVIAGRAKITDAIHPTKVEGLFVLPCGPIPPNPSEMLNSQAFIDILQQLNEQFDHILIDSPPVMAVADARILAACCDMTVLVLRAHKSTRKAAEVAMDVLAGVGGTVLGTVVNDVMRRRSRYGYGYGYGYGYYGGYGYSYGGYGHYGTYGRDHKGKRLEALPSNGNGSNGHAEKTAVVNKEKA